MPGELGDQDRSLLGQVAILAIAQNKVNAPLGACQNGALCLLRVQQKGDNGDVRRFARRIGLKLVPSGKHHDVLPALSRSGNRANSPGGM